MQELPPPMQLMQLSFAFMVSRSISVAAEFFIADKLTERPKTATELAGETGLHARSLYRMLRACASYGVFAEDEQGRFMLTPMAELLRSDQPGNLRAFTAMMNSVWQYQSWAEMDHAVKTGQPAFDKVFRMPFFEFCEKTERAGREFNEAMTSNSAYTSEIFLNAYNFTGFTKVVDVGGGHGILLASLLQRNPHLSGILYEMPALAAAASELMQQYSVADRCEQVGGDFFASVPEGGDLYILKHIIHDWNDEQCTRILSNCRKSMKQGGKVLVIEMVVPEGNTPSLAKLLDLQMLVCLPGCERTETEYRALFKKGGLSLSRILPMPSPFSIIEAVPIENYSEEPSLDWKVEPQMGSMQPTEQ